MPTSTWRESVSPKGAAQTKTQNPLAPSSDPPREDLIIEGFNGGGGRARGGTVLQAPQLQRASTLPTPSLANSQIPWQMPMPMPTGGGALTRPHSRRKPTAVTDRHLEDSVLDNEAALHQLGGPRLRVSQALRSSDRLDGDSNAVLCPMFAELEFVGKLFTGWDGKPTKLYRAAVGCIVLHTLCLVA